MRIQMRLRSARETDERGWQGSARTGNTVRVGAKQRHEKEREIQRWRHACTRDRDGGRWRNRDASTHPLPSPRCDETDRPKHPNPIVQSLSCARDTFRGACSVCRWGFPRLFTSAREFSSVDTRRPIPSSVASASDSVGPRRGRVSLGRQSSRALISP